MNLTKKMLLKLPERTQGTLMLRLFGLLKVPMLGYLRPNVQEMSDTTCAVKIPLSRRSKNHLGSLYFGALAAGADCAAGLVAMKFINKSGKKVDLVFKDFNAVFHKRAEGDTFFTNTQGQEVKELIKKCVASGEREELPMKIVATTPSKLGVTPVATFVLTLSLKKRA